MAGTGKAHLREEGDVVLRVEDLVVEFPVGRTGLKVNAVTGISFDVLRGETLGLVGESGCGKSTTGRAIMQLPRPTGGSVRLGDRELTALKGEELRRTRTQLQMIFQDPISSLNPRRKIKDIVGEGISIWGDKATKGDARGRVDQVLLDVGLDPEVIICDEPVSALDVSVQAQILNLLEQMKERYQLTLIFIAHDLAVVKNISDRVAVMYLGKMCELGPADTLYGDPAHPYTHALLASIPQPDPSIEALELETLQGELPSPIDPPSGCRFRTRCPRAEERCAEEEPLMREVADRHFVACHFPLVGETAPPEAGIPVRMKASA